MESTAVWLVTLGVLSTVIVFDLLIAIARRNKETTITEAGIWTLIYVAAALIFGYFMPNWTTDSNSQKEFFAGWLTEYALSVDNIFVFVIILARFQIERTKQQLVLLLGIIIALVLRGGFIAAGSAILERFSSAFFIFGAFLIFTAYKLLTEHEEEEEKQKEADARANAERQKVIEVWAQRVNQAKAEMPDFEDMVGSADVVVSNEVRDAIFESDVGPRILYHLAENSELAEKLQKMSPLSAVREIGKLEARFEKTEAQSKPIAAKSKAPAPINPLRSAANGRDVNLTSNGEYHGSYQAWKAARLAGRIR